MGLSIQKTSPQNNVSLLYYLFHKHEGKNKNRSFRCCSSSNLDGLILSTFKAELFLILLLRCVRVHVCALTCRQEGRIFELTGLEKDCCCISMRKDQKQNSVISNCLESLVWFGQLYYNQITIKTHTHTHTHTYTQKGCRYR